MNDFKFEHGVKLLFAAFSIFIIYQIFLISLESLGATIIILTVFGIFFLGTFVAKKYLESDFENSFDNKIEALGRVNIKLIVSFFISLYVIYLVLVLTDFEYINLFTIFHMSLVIAIAILTYTVTRYSKFMKGKESTDDLLENKIKARLRLTRVKTYHKSFPAKLNWIGGFVTPLYPFFSMINKNWAKKNMTQEAVIHENVHLHLMIYKGWSAFFLGYLVLANPYMFNLFPSKILNFLTFVGGFVVMMVWHEKITFDMTHDIGKKIKIKTRKWSNKIARKYFKVYFVWIIASYFVINGIFTVFEWAWVGIQWMRFLI